MRRTEHKKQRLRMGHITLLKIRVKTRPPALRDLDLQAGAR